MIARDKNFQPIYAKPISVDISMKFYHPGHKTSDIKSDISDDFGPDVLQSGPQKLRFTRNPLYPSSDLDVRKDSRKSDRKRDTME